MQTIKNAKLSTWKKDDLTRVYVSGLIGQGYGDKVWIEAQPVDVFGQDWTVKVKLAATTFGNRDLKDKTYELFGNGKECAAVSFEQICRMGE